MSKSAKGPTTCPAPPKRGVPVVQSVAEAGGEPKPVIAATRGHLRPTHFGVNTSVQFYFKYLSKPPFSLRKRRFSALEHRPVAPQAIGKGQLIGLNWVYWTLATDSIEALWPALAADIVSHRCGLCFDAFHAMLHKVSYRDKTTQRVGIQNR